MAADFGKYPGPKPDTSNANASHGTGADKQREGVRGTMGHSGNSGSSKPCK